MTRKVKVLDHGYVKFIEAWGRGEVNRIYDDMQPKVDMECGIIEAARQSTQGSFRDWDPYKACERCGAWVIDGQFAFRGDGACGDDHQQAEHKWKEYPKGDEGLLSFLFNSKPQHATPFEFAGMIVEIQAPIFVFREHQRHRTQSYNEMSARYAPLPDVNYIPSIERIMMGAQATTNKQAQGTGDKVITEEQARWFIRDLARDYAQAEATYQLALSTGVPKELARVILPVGRYSKMRASANLRNWLAFMTLRHDPGAQWEIQQYAAEVGNVIKAVFPRVHKLFEDQRSEEKAMRALWRSLSATQKKGVAQGVSGGALMEIADMKFAYPEKK